MTVMVMSDWARGDLFDSQSSDNLRCFERKLRFARRQRIYFTAKIKAD